jgi:glycosyltransferase involved in cell wall biosynthesis
MNNVTSKTMVSIGMPVYNGEKYIRQALDSLLIQTHANFELVISDNGSNDSTIDIVNDYAKNDDRIVFHRNKKNRGAIWNLNQVFDLTKYEYFMWASHDDYWYPDYVKVCLENFNNSDSLAMSCTDSAIVKDDARNVIAIDRGVNTIGKHSENRFIEYRKYLNIYPGADCIFYGLYNRKLLSKVMPMKTVIASDHILLASLSLQGEFYTENDILFNKRDGGACESIIKIVQSMLIKNNLLIAFPYLFREYYFQSSLLYSDSLNIHEKIKLSIWSILDYLLFSTKNIIRTQILSPMKKLLVRLGVYSHLKNFFMLRHFFNR